MVVFVCKVTQGEFPVAGWELCTREHCSHVVKQSAVYALCKAVFLWCVWCRGVSDYGERVKKELQVFRVVLLGIVRCEVTDAMGRVRVDVVDDSAGVLGGFSLCAEEKRKQFAGIFVEEGDDEATLGGRGRADRPAHVGV